MNYKPGVIFISAKQKNNISQILISEPETEIERLAGVLFIILEIQGKKHHDQQIASFIIDDIEKNYYQHEKILLRDSNSQVKIEHIFEAAIAKLNRNLNDYLETNNLKIDLNLTNIIIGVIDDNQLYFSNLGKNKALLIYRSKNKNPESTLQYNALDIIEKTKDTSQEIIHPNKLFSNVVNGIIPSGGYFVFANESLLEFLSTKQIIEIATTLPPLGAAEQIKNILEQAKVDMPFLGLIFKNSHILDSNLTKYELPPREAEVDYSSVEKLRLTEEKTSQFLKPSGLISLKDLANKFKSTKTQNKFQGFKNRVGELNLKKMQTISHTSKEKMISSVGLISKIFKKLINPKKIVTAVVITNNKLKHLNKKGRIILGIAGLCLIFLIINLIYVNYQKKQETKKQNYLAIVEKITQNENQIEANLIYNNKEDAKKNLANIKNLIASLPKNTEQEKADYKKIEANYLKRFDNINNVIRLTKPQEFIIFPTTIKPSKLNFSNNQVIVADETKQLHLIDIKDKKTNVVNIAKPEDGKIISSTIDNDKNIYYLDNKNLIKLSLTDKKISFPVIKNHSWEESTLIGYFSNKLYLTNSKDNQIYRLSKINNTFANPRTWLKDPLTISTIKNLAIDGYVYFLTNTAVIKYGSGHNQAFTLEATNPELQAGTKIIAPLDSNYLYILETKNKRVLIYNREGKYLYQYTAEQFNNLTDMAIDETGKNIYLLNNNIIYQVGLEKLLK